MMMALSFALLSGQTSPSAAPSQQQAEEIVVVGRRLRELRFNLGYRNGQLRKCEITRSTGDELLDKLACDAARVCARERPADVSILMACVEGRRDLIRAEYLETRNRAGQRARP